MTSAVIGAHWLPWLAYQPPRPPDKRTRLCPSRSVLGRRAGAQGELAPAAACAVLGAGWLGGAGSARRCPTLLGSGLRAGSRARAKGAAISLASLSFRPGVFAL